MRSAVSPPRGRQYIGFTGTPAKASLDAFGVRRSLAYVGDASKLLTAGVDAGTQIWSTTLTANRSVTFALPTTTGERFRIVRSAGGGTSFLLVYALAATDPLRLALGAPFAWCDLVFDGISFVATRAGGAITAVRISEDGQTRISEDGQMRLTETS